MTTIDELDTFLREFWSVRLWHLTSTSRREFKKRVAGFRAAPAESSATFPPQ